MKAAFHTFGCRLNQLETEALADSFLHADFDVVPFTKEALIYVVNTCTVTSKSEQKARGIIRRKSRENPRSIIIVTGCYVQMEEDLFQSLGPNVFAVSLGDKDLIQDYALFLMERETALSEIHKGGDTLLRETRDWFRDNHRLEGTGSERFRYVPEDFTYHTRAYLKIQDGCDNSCAYCRVTLARGPSVSLETEKVLERVAELEKKGYGEVTLTGVNIDSYHWGETDLADLLKLILDRTDSIHIRLSSLDPDTFTPALARVVAHERICPYFHLSVQSGSNTILSSMNRRYDSSQVIQAVELLRRFRDNPFISADIIVGFPGEGEKEFEETLSLMKKAEFTRAHVFPYSPRPGTAAWEMKNTVPNNIISERTLRLRETMARSQEKYAQSWIGKELDVVWEKNSDGYLTGLSGNYLNCRRKIDGGDGAVPGSREQVLAVEYKEKSGLILCRSL